MVMKSLQRNLWLVFSILLFIELQENLGLGVIFISHDLAVINSVCDDVLVMKDGNVVETGPTMEVINTPKDPYTIELLNSASA